MGQKCSCLSNGNSLETNTVFFPPTATQDEKTETSTVVNEAFLKIVRKRKDKIEEFNIKENIIKEDCLFEKDEKAVDAYYTLSSPLTKENENPNYVTFDNKKVSLKVLLNIQAIVKAFVRRKKFLNEEKKLLEADAENLLKLCKTTYTTLGLMKTEESCAPFDAQGWKKFYKEGEEVKNEPYFKELGVQSLLEVDYGQVFVVKVLKFGEDSFYTGQVDINNKKHGIGVLTHKDGRKFYGHWIKNEFSGWGRKVDSEGNLGEGYYVNGKLNDKGIKISFLNCVTFTGSFKNDLKEGNGREECEEYIYEGGFKIDLKEGDGKITYKNTHDYYEGNFSGNVISGTGYKIWSNRHSYRGTFIDGKMHGKGVYKWPDGGDYICVFFNNIKEGRGLFKWPNNRQFDGPFLGGNPHGVGLLTASGKTQEVEFIDGKINKNYKKGKSGDPPVIY